ncbi:hypothetical protein N7493_000459 [Penicillium malachiteum]|uniref:Zn(2)-C6 fungal-type domain-containing protein n=1 Tax=Penicillium malachiteum TaxID=1324776 RepID=A0AAD6HWQ7_9EURO|nr:hypothetical protein N7493_000459 [Penicillium malachiteum]
MCGIWRLLLCFSRQYSFTDNSKCDEKRPSCLNCINHDVECSFTSNESSAQSPQTETSDNVSEARPRPRRFRPYHYSTGELQQTFKLSKPKDQQVNTSKISTGTQCDIPGEKSGTISSNDLKLFHQFTISTYATMRIAEHDSHDLWQKHLPEWGIEFPPILHLILALSALHLGHEQPSLRDKYIQEADNHFTFGIRSVRAIISQLNAENCQRIYISAVLICFIYFGRGPRAGEYLVFSDTGPAEWIVLMQGVKLILQSHHEKVFSGLLEPQDEEVVYELTPAMRSELHEHTVHLQAVQRFVEEQNIDEAERSMYNSAITDLFEITRKVYEKVSGGKSGVALMDSVIGWLYRRPEEFILRLQQKDSYGLVILAYWALLLKYIESTWFMEGWSKHVLSGVEGSLHGEYRPWIEWPLRKVWQNS